MMITKSRLLRLLSFVVCTHVAMGGSDGAVSVFSERRIRIKIGMLFPYNNPDLKETICYVTTASAAQIAIERIQRERLLPNVDLSLVWYFTECDEALAAGYTSKLILEDNVDVIMAPPCSIEATMTAAQCKFYNTPVVSWGATDPELADHKRFPTLARTIGSALQLGRGLIEVLQHFNWNEIALLYNDDEERRKCYYFKRGFESAILEARPYRILVRELQEIRRASPTDEEMRDFLNYMKDNARVAVVCLGAEFDQRRFMLMVREMGLDSDEYVFILPDYFTANQEGSKIWKHPGGSDVDGLDFEARLAFQKAFVMEFQLEVTPKLQNFWLSVAEKMKEAPFFYKPAPDENIGSLYSPFLHDAVYLYAIALNKTLTEWYDRPPDANNSYTNTQNGTLAIKEVPVWRNGTKISHHCSDVRFDGESGSVVTDDEGSRNPNFVIKSFTAENQYMSLAIIKMHEEKGMRVALQLPEKKFWGTRKGVKPSSSPKCGWSGEKCPGVEPFMFLAAIGVVFLLLCGIVGGLLVKMRINAAALSKHMWRIGANELLPIDPAGSNSITSKISLQSDSSKKSTHPGRSKDYDFYYYKGTAVAVRNHNVHHSFRSKADKKELHTMRHMTHEDVNSFIGLCLDGPTVQSVWHLCSRGSLLDIFDKGNLKLDWYFKFSLVRDIATGLEYIFRSALGCHGSLSSHVCLIDDRWRLKITDFGLSSIKVMTPPKQSRLLWTAPELLRNNFAHFPLGTQEGDVYSLGVIISEIIRKKRPYTDVEPRLEPAEIVYKVRKGENPPFRPTIEADFLHEEGAKTETTQMINLMRDCWEERPDARPDIRTIHAQLKSMMRGKNPNLMDHVLNMMERYASTLEAQINERTEELIEEKKKSDLLLNRLLPKPIAEGLKRGEKCVPELFAAASVLFSDVVGFTVVCAQSTPMQVVQLLNDLYTLFDAIIEQSDVYKVETIGDSYLVVSGIPKRNGDKHASEIADLSLGFIRSIKTFRAEHLPYEVLQLRVGLNTGPVVAGVVGLAMPRYCLFGDTVNTASRMESHGKPNRIHITGEMNNMLKNVVGGYVTECRGEIIVKGKGAMTTHWLLGCVGDDGIETENVEINQVEVDSAECGKEGCHSVDCKIKDCGHAECHTTK